MSEFLGTLKQQLGFSKPVRIFNYFHQADYVRQYWTQSKIFRRILIAALVYVSLRLIIHTAMIVGMALYGQPDGDIPLVPQDLQVYLEAVQHLQQRQGLYPDGAFQSTNEPFYYAPSYAIIFTPFLWLFQVSPALVSLVHTALHLIAYGMLYYWWGRIFDQLGLKQVNQMLARTLPVWLIFSTFWADLGFLNIYIIMALLATLFIKAVLEEEIGWSVLWLSIILQTKPQWAFALVIPLLIGRFRFFFKLLTLTIIAYILMVGVTILFMGPIYGWQQHVDYVQFLSTLGAKFPWQTPADPFLGYNHSIKQIIFYRLGITSVTRQLIIALKIILLVPLFVITFRCLQCQDPRPDRRISQLSLESAFAFYLGAFIWLDVVWELSLSIVIFPYLLATSKRKASKVLVWAVFLPYALLDLWQVLSFITFGEAVILPGFYIATDPSIYLPLIMIVNLTFYTLLVGRLWTHRPQLAN